MTADDSTFSITFSNRRDTWVKHSGLSRDQAEILLGYVVRQDLEADGWNVHTLWHIRDDSGAKAKKKGELPLTIRITREV